MREGGEEVRKRQRAEAVKDGKMHRGRTGR